METKVYVRKVRVNPGTGHITLRLQSETTHEGATWSGPVKDYGFDTHVFHGRFAGDKQQLLNYVLGQHAAFMGRHQGLTEDLSQLEGKQIG